MGNCCKKQTEQPPEIVIIGCGIGGITVAQELAESSNAGKCNVTILEKGSTFTLGACNQMVISDKLKPEELIVSLSKKRRWESVS